MALIRGHPFSGEKVLIIIPIAKEEKERIRVECKKFEKFISSRKNPKHRSQTQENEY